MRICSVENVVFGEWNAFSFDFQNRRLPDVDKICITVWTQIRPTKMLVLIWIQNICILKRFFEIF